MSLRTQSPSESDLGTAGPGPPTDPVLEVWALFLRAHALMRRAVEARLGRRTPVPLADLEVVLQLEAALDGRLRMAALAERVLLSRSGLTRRIERLERLGLVERQTCPNDARGAYAVATPAGRALGSEVAADHLEAVREVFGAPLAGGDDLAAMRRELEGLIAAAEDRLRSAGACPSETGGGCGATDDGERLGYTDGDG